VETWGAIGGKRDIKKKKKTKETPTRTIGVQPTFGLLEIKVARSKQPGDQRGREEKTYKLRMVNMGMAGCVLALFGKILPTVEDGRSTFGEKNCRKRAGKGKGGPRHNRLI